MQYGTVIDIYSASSHGLTDILRRELKNTDVNKKNIHGNTALVFSVFNTKYETTKLLLENGAYPNIFGDYTPLMLSCTGSSGTITKLLLEYGANVLLKGSVYSCENTMMDMACENCMKLCNKSFITPVIHKKFLNKDLLRHIWEFL